MPVRAVVLAVRQVHRDRSVNALVVRLSNHELPAKVVR